MRKTWVDLPIIEILERDAAPDAPFSIAGLIETAKGILGAQVDPSADGLAQTVPVELSMALTALGGLSYTLAQRCPSSEGKVVEPLLATTYVDYYRAPLSHTSTKDDFLSHLDGALASGSSPVGFPPGRLDRTADLEHVGWGLLASASESLSATGRARSDEMQMLAPFLFLLFYFSLSFSHFLVSSGSSSA